MRIAAGHNGLVPPCGRGFWRQWGLSTRSPSACLASETKAETARFDRKAGPWPFGESFAPPLDLVSRRLTRKIHSAGKPPDRPYRNSIPLRFQSSRNTPSAAKPMHAKTSPNSMPSMADATANFAPSSAIVESRKSSPPANAATKSPPSKTICKKRSKPPGTPPNKTKPSPSSSCKPSSIPLPASKPAPSGTSSPG